MNIFRKLTVRGKILGTIVLVAALVVSCAAYLLSDALISSSGPGRYLKNHASRYQAAEEDLGQSEFAITSVVASDPNLAHSIADGEATEVVRVGKRLASNLQGSLAPDLFVLSDANGYTYRGAGLSKIDDGDWRSSRLYQDLRGGKTVRAKLAVLAGRAYRVSGVPVRLDGEVVGIVLLGRLLDTWFQHVATVLSNSKEPEKQHRISLVLRGEDVIASALPESMWATLVDAVNKPREVPDGAAADDTIPILDMGNEGEYDYWEWPAQGYAGKADPESTIGTYYLVRSRYHRTSKLQEDLYRLLTVFAAALLIAVIMGYLLAIQITRPLRRYIDATEGLTRGRADLTKRLEVDTGDELGVLARNLNRVFAKIHSFVF